MQVQNCDLFIQVARILKVCTGQIVLTTIRPHASVQTESLFNESNSTLMETRDSSRHSSMENLGKCHDFPSTFVRACFT